MREKNYDLLRIISTISVILIHVSGIYILAYQNSNIIGKIYTSNLFFSCLCNVITRFAVPCFVMLSGAFILSKQKTEDYKQFYMSSLKNIVIQLIIFSILYTLYSFCINVFNANNILKSLYDCLLSLLRGEPYAHLWYLYMLTGLYILAPTIVWIKNKIGDNLFKKVSIAFFIWAIISKNTSNYTLIWNIGNIFSYLGYFMIGYVIRNNVKKTSICHAFLTIFIGVIIEFILSYLYFQYLNKGYFDANLEYFIMDPYSIGIAISSIIIFIGFSRLNLVGDNLLINKIAKNTFYIYLIQSLILNLLVRIIKKWYFFNHLSNLVVIPILTIIVFIISYIFAIVYRIIFDNITKYFSNKKKD